MSAPLRRFAHPVTDYLQRHFSDVAQRQAEIQEELGTVRATVEELRTLVLDMNHRTASLEELAPRLATLDEINHRTLVLDALGARLQSLDQINHRILTVEESATEAAISARADADAVQVLAMVLERTLNEAMAQLRRSSPSVDEGMRTNGS